MNDIGAIDDDIRIFDTQVKKAENVCSVQLGSLYYADTFGVDLAYFLSEEFEFQNEAFKAYLIQRLAESSIDVTSVIETIEALYSSLVFNIPARPENSGLVR